MPERVPVPAISGGLDPFVGTDQQFGIPTGAELTGVFLTLQAAPSGGSCVVEIRTAAAGGGSAMVATFADGDRFATTTGSLDVSALSSLFLRVTASNGATDLSGTIELDGGDYLTSLERVKRWYGKKLAGTSLDASEMDALLGDLIAAVSQRIKTWTGRELVQKAYAGEVHDGNGRLDVLRLRQWPLASVSEVRIDGTALAGADWDFDADEAAIGLLRYVPGAWPCGRRNIEVDYVAGYSPVPQDLQDAATIQVGWDMLRAPAAGGRIGVRQTVLEGGDQVFMVDDWAPDALSRIRPYREARV